MTTQTRRNPLTHEDSKVTKTQNSSSRKPSGPMLHHLEMQKIIDPWGQLPIKDTSWRALKKSQGRLLCRLTSLAYRGLFDMQMPLFMVKCLKELFFNCLSTKHCCKIQFPTRSLDALLFIRLKFFRVFFHEKKLNI